MAKNDNLKDFLTDVADAIREKKGTEDLINPQDFSDEIKNLPSGSSPFAVDFGEDVAAQSAEMIDTLKEDLEYYYEIERQRAAGEVTDDQLLKSEEFMDKIAWWPKGMSEPTTTCWEKFKNMRVIKWKFPSNSYNKYFRIGRHLSIFAPDVSQVQSDWGQFLSYGSVEHPVSLRFDKATKCRNAAFMGLSCPSISLEMPMLESFSGDFLRHSYIDVISVDLPKVTTLSNFCRDNVFKELYANIPSVTNALYSIYNNAKETRVCKIKGLQTSINISFGISLELDSIKYILDNCQARADGASYTLTLYAAVKTAFLAKCDEDAEYAASLASANAKGLTLA